MALLSSLYRHALWIGVPAFCAGVYLLVQCISGAIRTGRQARLADVPVIERQPVELAAPGDVVLELEGPIFTRVPAELGYRLVGPGGEEVPGRATLFPVQSSGVSRGRKELRVFHVGAPGRHELRVEGLSGDRTAYAELRLILKRPTFGKVVGWILGMILSGALIVGSVVAFFLRLAEVRGTLGPGGTGG